MHIIKIGNKLFNLHNIKKVEIKHGEMGSFELWIDDALVAGGGKETIYSMFSRVESIYKRYCDFHLIT